jgi:hypothetical protein
MPLMDKLLVGLCFLVYNMKFLMHNAWQEKPTNKILMVLGFKGVSKKL